MKYKCVVVRRHGPPDALQVEQAELADPGPGEVRVRVQATGVAFSDILMRYGVYPARAHELLEAGRVSGKIVLVCD